jgi:hypothetical protein
MQANVIANNPQTATGMITKYLNKKEDLKRIIIYSIRGKTTKNKEANICFSF